MPSLEDMIASWGSGEAWQRAMTLAWIQQIANSGSTLPVLFEGQMRLAFIREGLEAAGVAEARVVLIDCDDETRTHRLLTGRKQPELANPTMKNWASFLRREARERGHEVLDTSNLSLEAAVQHICALLLDPTSK